MLMLMIDGDEHDLAQLRQRVPWAGFEIEVRQVAWSELSAPDTRGIPVTQPTQRPKALVFEARDRPALGAAALTLVRASRLFEDVPAIAALTIDGVDWLESAQGFDDFVIHPWSPGELLGRIRAARMRRRVPGPDPLVAINGVRLDPGAREATISGQSVHLTSRELALLTYLCVRRGSVLSRNHLLEHVWGEAYHGGPRTVDVHIRRLRSKLGGTLQIDTVRRGGYRLRAGRPRELPACGVAQAEIEP
jgi:DNA-binding response OmpR family regulator